MGTGRLLQRDIGRRVAPSTAPTADSILLLLLELDPTSLTGVNSCRDLVVLTRKDRKDKANIAYGGID